MGVAYLPSVNDTDYREGRRERRRREKRDIQREREREREGGLLIIILLYST